MGTVITGSFGASAEAQAQDPRKSVSVLHLFAATSILACAFVAGLLVLWPEHSEAEEAKTTMKLFVSAADLDSSVAPFSASVFPLTGMDGTSAFLPEGAGVAGSVYGALSLPPPSGPSSDWLGSITQDGGNVPPLAHAEITLTR